MQSIVPMPNVIYAYTISPQAVIDAFEHHTASLSDRLFCAAALMRAGCPVRLCFDPMIYLPGWKTHYSEMMNQVYRSIAVDQLLDVSIGTFRISQDYLKNMRKQAKDSAVIWFPFQKEDGYCHYPAPLMEEMESFLTAQIAEKIDREKIFRWNV